MTFSDLSKEIKNVYKNKFNNSKIEITHSLMWKNIYFVRCKLARQKREYKNDILNEDMFNILFSVKRIHKHEYIMENTYSTYDIKSQNILEYYGKRKIYFKRVYGTESDILRAFSRFVDKLYMQLEKDLKNDLIHEKHVNLLKEKLKNDNK